MIIIPEAIIEALWEEFKEETLPAILKSRLFWFSITVIVVSVELMVYKWFVRHGL